MSSGDTLAGTVPGGENKSERESLRRWPRTSEGLQAARAWLTTQIDELRAYRAELVTPAVETFLLRGVETVDQFIRELETIRTALGFRRKARIPWRDLDALLVRADDHLLADATLRLVPLVEDAKARFPTAPKFSAALAKDTPVRESILRFCHGMEDLFVAVPRPALPVPGSALASDEGYLHALRVAYDRHAAELLRVLACDEVVNSLFGTTCYGSGATKATEIAISSVAGISPQSIFNIRRELGLAYRRPMGRRRKRKDVAPRAAR